MDGMSFVKQCHLF